MLFKDDHDTLFDGGGIEHIPPPSPAQENMEYDILYADKPTPQISGNYPGQRLANPPIATSHL